MIKANKKKKRKKRKKSVSWLFAFATFRKTSSRDGLWWWWRMPKCWFDTLVHAQSKSQAKTHKTAWKAKFRLCQCHLCQIRKSSLTPLVRTSLLSRRAAQASFVHQETSLCILCIHLLHLRPSTSVKTCCFYFKIALRHCCTDIWIWLPQDPRANGKKQNRVPTLTSILDPSPADLTVAHNIRTKFVSMGKNRSTLQAEVIKKHSDICFRAGRQ